ncbi:MAG TPA: oligosaccharide flippase family protein [Puia sp.]|nr:oligosaccharide flippase family protein [Puia sp.]
MENDSDRGRLIRNISANTLQVLGNQFLGVFVFLIISRSLDKPSFGELSWSLAVLTLITTLLSLRLEQIVVRNVAAGDNPSGVLTLFAAHNFFMGLVFFGVLSIVCFLGGNHFLWILSVSQILTFWALPFRQLLAGRGAFGWLALLASISNLIRAMGLYFCVIYSTLKIPAVVVLFTLSALVELLLGIWIVCGRLGIGMTRMNFASAYASLIRSSLPQVGVVFLQAGIARVDWILMGILSTPAHTAEYTFAYRAFEFAPLPLLVIAPLLLNRLAREEGMGSAGRNKGRANEPFLDRLVRLELLLATLPTLWLTMAWAPLVDLFTASKYGASNTWTFLILACCIPFQYINNLYWSQEFARNRLSLILSVTAVTGVIMLAGDVILIPYYAGAGAAAAFLAATIVQYILYARASDLEKKREWGGRLLLSMVIAGGSGVIAAGVTNLLTLQLLLGTALYCLSGWLTGTLRIKENVLLWNP